jgi:DNA ligase 1
MTTHPTLYKKTSTGAIQYWKISSQGDQVITEYGQVGTDSPQVTTDTAFGKNAGRANETSAAQQAEAEAKSAWTKKLKKGYVDSIAAAEAGERDAIIEGGIDPMLAHKYSVNGIVTKDAKKIKFPAFGQPKMDGIRCIATKINGVTTLWTRTRKPITSVPHIVAAIDALPISNIILDGELYNHDYRQDFDTIIELVRPDEPVPGHEVVQFWCYDVVNDKTNQERDNERRKIIALHKGTTLVLVETHIIKNAADVNPFKELMLEHGFEGSMIRNADAVYKNGRSYDLQKCKDMQDEEFQIVDFEEGSGRLQGHVGSFWCIVPNDPRLIAAGAVAGARFKAKCKGKTENLRKYFQDHKLWTGKLLTVQYQNYTPDGKPRFPVGKNIRDFE